VVGRKVVVGGAAASVVVRRCRYVTAVVSAAGIQRSELVMRGAVVEVAASLCGGWREVPAGWMETSRISRR